MDTPPPSRIRQARVLAGLSQSALARSAGITRQAMNAIELGRYVPNTTVSILIARALGASVEDLFAVPEDTRIAVAEAPRELRAGDRVTVGRVGDRLVAHPRTGARSFVEAFAPADGVWTDDGAADVFAHGNDVDGTAFIAGCDPSLGLLASLVTRRLSGGRLVWIPSSSERALLSVSRSTAHVAGIHLPDPTSDRCNVDAARRTLHAGGLLVGYAAWEQGLVVRHGNPLAVTSPASLATAGLRIVNREAGAGSRVVLDKALSQAGIPGSAINGYDSEVRSHFAVATAVVAGAADAGVALQAVADAEGLDFVPLAFVNFDLVIPSAHLEHRAIKAMLDVLQEARTRRDLGSLPGYETRDAGIVRERFDVAA